MLHLYCKSTLPCKDGTWKFTCEVSSEPPKGNNALGLEAYTYQKVGNTFVHRLHGNLLNVLNQSIAKTGSCSGGARESNNGISFTNIVYYSTVVADFNSILGFGDNIDKS